MLERVGIADPEIRIKDYPHQFSGGMRQRIMVAIALATRPGLLVADEPTSALDVTLEAQIVDLIGDLRRELGTAVLYITHDLGVVAQLCDRVMVMYAGSIVESGDVYTTFAKPRHPYTQALLRSHPSRSARRSRLVTIPGRVPSLRDLPPGCKFAPRCHRAEAICLATEPLAHAGRRPGGPLPLPQRGAGGAVRARAAPDGRDRRSRHRPRLRPRSRSGPSWRRTASRRTLWTTSG